MLMRHTTDKIVERKNLVVNPVKTCQPIGAMYAALGIHRCMPHSHGSQGCCAYHRSMLTRHYKEPVMATTSSFTEGASVFGGMGNLMDAIANIFSLYDPDVIAVHTTCLSETIGDDIPQIVKKAKDNGLIPRGKHVFHANTPSYVGTHITGYASMVKAMVDYFSVPSRKRSDQINLVPGFVDPPDMEELRRISSSFGVAVVMFPDTSGVLNTGLTGSFKMFPRGGTRVSELVASGEAIVTLGLGRFAAGPAARALDAKCGVPCEILDLPIGLAATDRFVMALSRHTGVPVPDDIAEERARVVDLVADMHQYLYGKRVAVAGDPDHLFPLVEFLLDLEMDVQHIVTGMQSKKIERRMEELFREKAPDKRPNFAAPGDLFLLHQWIKNNPVDLIIGNTHTKYIARDENIPSVRVGFPILDRVGHQYFPIVGYRGAVRLLEMILNAFLERVDATVPEESFELVM